MTIRGGADIIIIADENTLIEALKASDVRVANVNGLFVFAFGRLGDFFAVFICPRDKVGAGGGISASGVETGKAGDCIGGGCLVGVAHVCWTVGVVDGGGDVKALFVVSGGGGGSINGGGSG